MTARERQQLIDFIQDAIYEIEGVMVDRDEIGDKSSEELQKDADWYDYLLGK